MLHVTAPDCQSTKLDLNVKYQYLLKTVDIQDQMFSKTFSGR